MTILKNNVEQLCVSVNTRELEHNEGSLKETAETLLPAAKAGMLCM
jgi:hypothetical protein